MNSIPQSQKSEVRGQRSEVRSRRLIRPLVGITLAGLLLAAGIGAGAVNPTTQPANLPPSSTSPQPAPKATLVPVPYRPWLPAARTPREPRIVPSDGQHALRTRRALDLPPVAELTADLPAPPQLEVGPPIQIRLLDLSPIPVATLASKADAGTPTLGTDPTLDLAPAGALVVSPPPRTIAPQALLLPIPDPSHQQGAIAVAASAGDEAPVANVDRPGPTTLPAGK